MSRLNSVDFPTLGKPTMTTLGVFFMAGTRPLFGDQGVLREEGPAQVDVAAQGLPLPAFDEEGDPLDGLLS